MTNPTQDEVRTAVAEVLGQVAELAATPEGLALMKAERDAAIALRHTE